MKYLLSFFLIISSTYTKEPFPSNHLAEGAILALHLETSIIYVHKGACEFNLWNKKIRSTIGPIQAIRTIITPEGKEKIEWHNGIQTESFIIPSLNQTWKEYFDDLPNNLIDRLFRYFMQSEPPND